MVAFCLLACIKRAFCICKTLSILNCLLKIGQFNERATQQKTALFESGFYCFWCYQKLFNNL